MMSDDAAKRIADALERLAKVAEEWAAVQRKVPMPSFMHSDPNTCSTCGVHFGPSGSGYACANMHCPRRGSAQ